MIYCICNNKYRFNNMNKRQTAAQETRRKLITAGLELIKENGFDAINVEDITKKAGVAKKKILFLK